MSGISFSLSGAVIGSGVFGRSTASLSISEPGTTTVTYAALGAAGNPGASQTLTIHVDPSTSRAFIIAVGRSGGVVSITADTSADVTAIGGDGQAGESRQPGGVGGFR